MATVTWARSVSEGHALVQSLRHLSHAGLRIAVADRGSDVEFLRVLENMSGVTVTVPSTEGMVQQVQASVRVAATFATPFILYAESDKHDFFVKRLDRFLVRAPTATDIGIVLASRSRAAIATFPPMQRYAEGVVNHLCSQLIGAAGDYSYGPFLMNRAMLENIVAFKPGLGWGWRPATFVAAHRQRLRIVHLVDDHHCPVDQREEDEAARVYRLQQLSQNIYGLT